MNDTNERYKEYVSGYDLNIPAIAMKYNHCLRVADACEEIARSINLNERQIYVAKTAGLLHDIGRFFQWKTYRTFDDSKTIKHGKYGTSLIRLENLFNQFGLDLSSDEKDLILTAIDLHSDRTLPDLSKSQKRLCDILRDADKLDILKVTADDITNEKMDIIHFGVKKRKDITGSKFTKMCVEDILNRVLLERRFLKTSADQILPLFTFAYQLKYDYTRLKILENGSYDKIRNGFDFVREDAKSDFEKIYENTMDILNTEIKRAA